MIHPKHIQFAATLLIAGALLSVSSCGPAGNEGLGASQKQVQVAKCLQGQKAAVACAHPEAARVGAEILAMGGNAIDASIAIQWALAVCYPEAGNLGGGGLMVARMQSGESFALDFRESAPATAHRNFYLDEQGEVIPGKSTDTHYGAGIPGTVHGLYTAHERFGKLPMHTLLAPAVGLAANGFPITENQARNLNKYKKAFDERNSKPTAFQHTQADWKAGDTLVQAALAATLERILAGGAEEFYKGETAQLMVKEMESHGQWFTIDDLANYEAKWREPISCTFDSVRVWSMPPPSSGGIALCQLIEMFHIARADTLEHNSAAYMHALVEMQRRVYADRSVHLGDPDYHEVPTVELLDRAYLVQRFADFDPHQATPSSTIREGAIHAESMETTHLSVVDQDGNAVAVTTTLNDIYGSKIVVSGAGFLLNNEIDDFSLKPGAPNMYGLVGGDANAVAPGKRMLSSMTPTIVEKNNALFLVAGSPGGSTIITSVLQTVLNAVYHEMPLEEVINKPKFHSQWLPDDVVLERNRFDESQVEAIKALGHEIRYVPSLGRVDAIVVLPDGSLNACGDSRSDNAAAGF